MELLDVNTSIAIVLLFCIYIIYLFFNYKKDQGDNLNDLIINKDKQVVDQSYLLLLEKLSNIELDPVDAEKAVNKILKYVNRENNRWNLLNTTEEELKEYLRLSRVRFYKKLIKGLRNGNSDINSSNYPNFPESMKLFVDIGNTSWKELEATEQELIELFQKAEV